MLKRLLHTHSDVDDSMDIISIVLFGYLFLAIIFSVLAYSYPIRSREDPEKFRTSLSMILAVVFFPAYLIILAYENPVRINSGKTSLFISIVTLPIYFFVAPTDYWQTYQTKILP